MEHGRGIGLALVSDANLRAARVPFKPMHNLVEIIEADPAVTFPTATPSILRKWSVRVGEAFSFWPTQASDLPQLRRLLSIAVGVMLLFVTACVFNANWYE